MSEVTGAGVPKTRLTAAEIREVRDYLVMTQGALADFLGVGLPTISSWETGRSHPSALVSELLWALKAAAARDPSIGGTLVHLYRKHGRARALLPVLRCAFDV